MFVSRNIKYFYLKTVRKIRNFLLSDKSREFLIFLFFFLIAAAFWLLQTLNYDYEAEFSIPLKLKNTPNDVVLTSDLPRELRVSVKDKGTVLLNYMLGQSFYPINIDFEDYKNRGNHVYVSVSDLTRKIVPQLVASTKILGIKPDTIDYIYTKGKVKKVPVRLRGTIATSKQYYVADTVCSPDSVVVYAPKSLLDTIKAAYTQEIEIENITDTIRKKILLAKVKGVKFVPNSVNVTFLVDIFTEKTLEVPIEGINFPAGKILRTFPSKVNVTFKVGLKQFKQIHAEDFVINISYEELLKNTSDKYKVRLKSVPPGISNIRISPEKVDFLIEQISPNDEY